MNEAEMEAHIHWLREDEDRIEGAPALVPIGEGQQKPDLNRR